MRTPKTPKLNTSSGNDDKGKTSTGKKLVQARLPFKVLSTAKQSSASATQSNKITETNSVADEQSGSRKRKLQYDDDTDKHIGETQTKVLKSIVQTDVKENLKSNITLSSSEVCSVEVNSTEVVEVISDDENNSTKNESTKCASDKDSKTSSISDSDDEESKNSKSSKNLLKIKFPFGQNKKRIRQLNVAPRDTRKTSSSSGDADNRCVVLVKKIGVDEIDKYSTRHDHEQENVTSDDEAPISDSDEEEQRAKKILLVQKANEIRAKRQEEIWKIQEKKLTEKPKDESSNAKEDIVIITSDDECERTPNKNKHNSARTSSNKKPKKGTPTSKINSKRGKQTKCVDIASIFYQKETKAAADKSLEIIALDESNSEISNLISNESNNKNNLEEVNDTQKSEFVVSKKEVEKEKSQKQDSADYSEKNNTNSKDEEKLEETENTISKDGGKLEETKMTEKSSKNKLSDKVNDEDSNEGKEESKTEIESLKEDSVEKDLKHSNDSEVKNEENLHKFGEKSVETSEQLKDKNETDPQEKLKENLKTNKTPKTPKTPKTATRKSLRNVKNNSEADLKSSVNIPENNSKDITNSDNLADKNIDEGSTSKENEVAQLSSGNGDSVNVCSEKGSLSFIENTNNHKASASESDKKSSSMIELTEKSKQSSKLTPTRLKKLQEMEKRREERIKAQEQRQKKLEDEKEQKRKEREEKELQRKREREEKEEQKRREREEKEEQRRREREEKEEQKRREKEEKEEQRKREKEEKEKKRLAEIESKNEEKRRKDEQKEEERRRKEEERKKKEQEKEEAENKIKRAAQAFTKFFLQSKPSTSAQQSNEIINDGCISRRSSADKSLENSTFMPFQIKGHMKLAPLFRRRITEEEKDSLDQALAKSVDDEKSIEQSTSVSCLYLDILKSGKYTPGRDTKIYTRDDESTTSDVIVVEDELEGAGQVIDDTETTKTQKYKAKFLYFHENQRPPYYGTWRKKSRAITARRPFALDTVYFDYEIDSDDEWEEEEPGESLNGSDDEKDKESEDDYEVDNDFFVPHGHLSEEELQNEDGEDEDNSPETQKAKLKILQQEFAQEMKKKTEKIKPKLVGIVWVDENGNQPDTCPDIIWSSLNKRAMIFATSPIIIEPPEKLAQQNGERNENSGADGSGTSHDQQQKSQKIKIKLPEILVKDLIRLVHCNRHKRDFLIKEFQAYVAKKYDEEKSLTTATEEIKSKVEYSKIFIRKKIDKIAEWKLCENYEKGKKKMCWMVSLEILKKYELEDLTSPNTWSYILEVPPKKQTVKKIENDDDIQVVEQSTEKDETVVKEESKLIGITKFTKVLTKEEKEKQMKSNLALAISKQDKNCIQSIEENNTTTKPGSSSTVVKKRVPLLLSVPRGQQIPQSSKDKLISDFLNKKTDEKSTEKQNDVHNDGDSFHQEEKKPCEKSTETEEKKDAGIRMNEKPQDIKKRVPLLLSVPIGQQIPQGSKDKLINDFLKKKNDEKIIEKQNGAYEDGGDNLQQGETKSTKIEMVTKEKTEEEMTKNTVSPMEVDDVVVVLD